MHRKQKIQSLKRKDKETDSIWDIYQAKKKEWERERERMRGGGGWSRNEHLEFRARQQQRFVKNRAECGGRTLRIAS